MKDLEQIEKIKDRINERLTNLNINIKVDASFIMMLVLLLEELETTPNK